MPESTIIMVMFLMVFGVYAGRKKRGPYSRWMTPLCVLGLGVTGFVLGSVRSGIGIGMITGVIFIGAGLYLLYQEAKRGGLRI